MSGTTAHKPVTTILAGPNDTATVHFYCSCGISRRNLILDARNHPASRYAAAIRSLHQRGLWPAPDVELGDGETAGWGPPAWDDTAA